MSRSDDGCRLFVGGLSMTTTDESLRAYFASFYPVMFAEVKRKQDSHHSRGFGFVTFTSTAAAEAIFAQQPHNVDGKVVELRRGEAKSNGGGNSSLTRSVSSVGAGLPAVPTSPEDAVMRRLVVVGLPGHLTRSDVAEYFGHCGTIEDVVLADGDATVTFASSASVDVAQRARPHTVRGSAVETKRATPTHLVGRPEAGIVSTKVFLGPPDNSVKGQHGLGEETTDADLGVYFGQYGTVLSVKQIMWEDTQRKRGYGYIEMEDGDQVDKIVLVRIHSLRGRLLEAKKALTREQMRLCGMESRPPATEGRGTKRGPEESGGYGGGYGGGMGGGEGKRTRPGRLTAPRDSEDPAMRKLFVGNLHSSTTKASMEEYFRQFGELEQCYCASHENTGKCKGYGFLTFKHSTSVDEVQRTRPHDIMGRQADTKRAVPRDQANNPESEMRSKKLYITGLHGPKSGLNDTVSNADLEEYFGKYGKVVSVDQKLQPGIQKKTGFGFIEFTDEDPVDKLVLQGVIELGGGVVLEARRGLNREQQEELKHKQAQMQMQGGGGEMQGMMQDMQRKMVGAGMGGMAGQMGQMSNMMNNLGADEGMQANMQNMMQSMTSMMASLGNNPSMAANMSNMMMTMMNMCQQMMMAATGQGAAKPAVSGGKSESQWGGSQGDYGSWGGGYGSSQPSSSYGYGGSSQGGGYGSGSQSSYGSGSQGTYGSWQPPLPKGEYRGQAGRKEQGAHGQGHARDQGNYSHY